jgi:transcriptional regulator with XRE-family HTH domain
MATVASSGGPAAVRYAEELTEWRERRRLTKKALAAAMSYDPSYVSHIEACRQLPTEAFTRQAEAVLQTGGALWARWDDIESVREPPAPRRPPQRELRQVEFVAWLADHSSAQFGEIYAAVERAVAECEAESPSRRLDREHVRRHVTRARMTSAIADYYGTTGLYRARVGAHDLTLSIVTNPGWLAYVELGGSREHFRYVVSPWAVAPKLDHATLRAAIGRIAAVETSNTVMVNNPLYRLTDFAFGDHELTATVTTVDFAAYALTADLLADELADAIVARGGQLPLRAAHLPDVAAALDFGDRACVGGLNALVAAARSSRPGRPADYVLFVQERSSAVLNVPGALAVIPKAFHQPVGEASAEARLSVTLRRELEEELLGRADLEQLTGDGRRQADPLHAQQTSAPLAWLLDRADVFRTECTGFGVNLLTGNYDFPCLVVIDDPDWWDTFGHQVATNWEALRVRRYSSLDTAGLEDLVADPRWSNEGLFGLVQGLLRLGQIGEPARIALPPIVLET